MADEDPDALVTQRVELWRLAGVRTRDGRAELSAHAGVTAHAGAPDPDHVDPASAPAQVTAAPAHVTASTSVAIRWAASGRANFPADWAIELRRSLSPSSASTSARKRSGVSWSAAMITAAPASVK